MDKSGAPRLLEGPPIDGSKTPLVFINLYDFPLKASEQKRAPIFPFSLFHHSNGWICFRGQILSLEDSFCFFVMVYWKRVTYKYSVLHILDRSLFGLISLTTHVNCFANKKKFIFKTSALVSGRQLFQHSFNSLNLSPQFISHCLSFQDSSGQRIEMSVEAHKSYLSGVPLNRLQWLTGPT